MNLARKGPGADGYITAAEWSAMDMRSNLVVLSACDTATGSTAAGEGVLGMPYAMFVAGNRNMLLTLWPLDDSAAVDFMERFYRRLNSGISQVEALAQTKRYFMTHERKEWRHPMYWAIFTLYGV